jgi:hypothetical protein
VASARVVKVAKVPGDGGAISSATSMSTRPDDTERRMREG